MKTKVTELTVSRSCSSPPPQKTEALEKTRGLSQVVETSRRHLPVNFVVLRIMNGFAGEDELTTPPPSDQWVRRPAQSGSVLLSPGIYKKWPDICHGCKKKKMLPTPKDTQSGDRWTNPGGESHVALSCGGFLRSASRWCGPSATKPGQQPPTHRHNNTEMLQVVCLERWWRSLVNSQSIRRVLLSLHQFVYDVNTQLTYCKSVSCLI